MSEQDLLQSLGWDDTWDTKWQAFSAEVDSEISARFTAGRVAHEHKIGYRLFTAIGTVETYLPSRFKHKTPQRSDWPAVGDWVVYENDPARAGDVDAPYKVVGILPRKTCLLRKVAGLQAAGQVLAVNVDVVYVVMGLDEDYNLRRLERYLALISESGARAVIVLNKTDLCSTLKDRVAEVQQLAGETESKTETPILTACATQSFGVDAIKDFLPPGSTAALIGSSGVGKSTIINDLLAENRQAVNIVRASDGKGQHTTVARDLIMLPHGGIIIDNPGIREVQLIVDAASLAEAFPEITVLAQDCRFSDCAHISEPGCTVLAAIEAGTLSAPRLENYLELQAEVAILQKRFEARQKRSRPPKRRRNLSGRGGRRSGKRLRDEAEDEERAGRAEND